MTLAATLSSKKQHRGALSSAALKACSAAQLAAAASWTGKGMRAGGVIAQPSAHPQVCEAHLVMRADTAAGVLLVQTQQRCTNFLTHAHGGAPTLRAGHVHESATWMVATAPPPASATTASPVPAAALLSGGGPS